jgi:hypothetical protein
MLVCKAVIDGLRTMILIAGISLSLLAQEESGRALASTLDRVLAAGQTERARQVLDEILAHSHVDLGVLLEAGAKLADHDLFEMARAVFARGVSDYPQSFEARYNLAMADFALGRLLEAQTTLDSNGLLSQQQRLSREYLRGKIYEALGQTEPIWPKEVC